MPSTYVSKPSCSAFFANSVHNGEERKEHRLIDFAGWREMPA